MYTTMLQKLPQALADWTEHHQDFVVIHEVGKTTSAQEKSAYLIVNRVRELPCIIEDYALAAATAEAMIAAGVQVVSVAEAQAMMFPKPARVTD